MRKICLSVLIPMYNVEKYIGECLDSILSNKVQDFEYEVIVADDGSTDGSLGVAKDFEARYDNVKVFSFANRGVSLTRKFLLNEAKGDFVWFVDADDYVDENVFVCIQKALDEEKTDVLIFDYRLKVGEDFLQGDFREEKESTYDNGIACWLNCKLNVEIWNKVIRKSLLDEACFIEQRCYCEDLYFIFRLFSAAQNVKVATFCGYYYRRLDTSVSIAVEFQKDRLYDHLGFFCHLNRIADKNTVSYCATFFARVIRNVGFVFRTVQMDAGVEKDWCRKATGEIATFVKRNGVFYKHGLTLLFCAISTYSYMNMRTWVSRKLQRFRS